MGGRARYARSRRLFFTLLGLVWAIAFASLGVQAEGLFGAHGIAPIADKVEWYGEHQLHWRSVPSLFWLGASDAAVTSLWAVGLALSLLLATGLVVPRLLALAVWASYLSFVSFGDPFLSFQWDVLLLEVGLLAVVYAPGGIRPRWGEPSRVARWLLAWVLFRVVFLSGVVKLASGDETWRGLTALQYHYETQPLPHALSAYAHALPDWLHQVSVVATLAIELGAPVLLFAPPRARRYGVAAIALLLLLIVATGNYGFFEPLTLVLCLAVLDDELLERMPLVRLLPIDAEHRERGLVRGALVTVFAALALLLTVRAGLVRTRVIERDPSSAWRIERELLPLRSFNAYGLFEIMTTERPEILVEGSLDGVEWRPYRFRWKPGPLDRRPGFAGPHMPRLDWQMWFAALGGFRRSAWYQGLARRLLEGEPGVLALLDGDPFEGEGPPRYLRSKVFLYELTSPAERRESGHWWRRERRGPFGPVLTLVDGELRAVGF